MRDKIKLTPDQFKVFETGHRIESEAGMFYNFPYWLKKNGEEDLYEEKGQQGRQGSGLSPLRQDVQPDEHLMDGIEFNQ